MKVLISAESMAFLVARLQKPPLTRVAVRRRMAGEVKMIVGAALLLLLTSLIVRSNKTAQPAG